MLEFRQRPTKEGLTAWREVQVLLSIKPEVPLPDEVRTHQSAQREGHATLLTEDRGREAVLAHGGQGREDLVRRLHFLRVHEITVAPRPVPRMFSSRRHLLSHTMKG